MSDLRAYRSDDFDAVTRIWREVGWIDADNDTHAEALRHFLAVGDAVVVELDGSAECCVHRSPGHLQVASTMLPMCAITAVTTSRVARQGGHATLATAHQLGAAAIEGAAVAGLGMFEQGFYDRLGFGSSSYSHRATFDPADLRVPKSSRTPVRVGPDDWTDVHGAMVGRMRGHGAVTLTDPELVRAELSWLPNPWGLGYRDGTGRLTHCMLGEAVSEHGPYRINWLAYETLDQFLELLGLLRALADQVYSVELTEPAAIQMQDLIATPLKRSEQPERSPIGGTEALAESQFRILDVGRCVAALGWPGEPVVFDLTLTDPLAGLPGPWAGCGGRYTVTIDRTSSAVPGHRRGLPELKASIGAFTRLWLGVRPATGLARTDDLRGPAALLERLDVAIAARGPHTGWDF